MGKCEGFIAQTEVIMRKFIGNSVGQSILRYNLVKFNKGTADFTVDDCKTLVQNVTRGISLFVTREEAGRIKAELDKLFEQCFPQSREGLNG